jgi:hypothetical protein
MCILAKSREYHAILILLHSLNIFGYRSARRFLGPLWRSHIILPNLLIPVFCQCFILAVSCLKISSLPSIDGPASQRIRPSIHTPSVPQHRCSLIGCNTSAPPTVKSHNSWDRYIRTTLLRESTCEHDGFIVFEFVDKVHHSRGELSGGHVEGSRDMTANVIIITHIHNFEGPGNWRVRGRDRRCCFVRGGVWRLF